jgi:hypothetical protein
MGSLILKPLEATLEKYNIKLVEKSNKYISE